MCLSVRVRFSDLPMESLTLKKFLSCLLLILIFSRCSQSQVDDPIRDNYLTYLFLTTASLPCVSQTYKNPFGFTDPSGDVKAGFLNIPNNEIGHLDLISGNVHENTNDVSFQLELASVPETIDVNLNEDKTSPEYEWNYLFQGENSFKISITHYPDGIPEKISFRNLNVMAWKNQTFIGGCGNLSIQGNVISWLCDKSTIPALGEISLTRSITIESKAKNRNILYSDCN